jgi:hypothetical protein
MRGETRARQRCGPSMDRFEHLDLSVSLDGRWCAVNLDHWTTLVDPRRTSSGRRGPAAEPNRGPLLSRGIEVLTFNDKGVVWDFEGTAEFKAKQATNFVWRHLMLRPFTKAVSTRAVVLYGRPNISASFEILATDVWPRLTIVDWDKGDAAAPDGTHYWSIHADLTKVEVVSRHRGPPPVQRERVQQAMARDVRDERLSLSELQEMDQEALAARYGASRDTVVKARHNVVSEFVGKPNSDK